MHSAPLVARVLRSGTAAATLPRRRRSLQPRSTTFALLCACRTLSQQGSRWVDKLRYGAEDAPSLGSWDNAYEDNAMDTRKLYCKALVHASGGSRLARDWIAGCAALTSPDPSLIYTALQHTASEGDVAELREHFLRRLLSQETDETRRRRHSTSRCSSSGDDGVGGDGREGVRRSATSLAEVENEDETEREVLREGEEAFNGTVAAAASSTQARARGASAAAHQLGDAGDHDGAAKQHDDDGEGEDVFCSPEEILAAEHLLLSRSPEVRCFMYDAMTASLFHSNYDLRTVEVARRHTFWIGTNVFGIALDELTLLWRVVEAELLLKKEKIKVLGQPWSE